MDGISVSWLHGQRAATGDSDTAPGGRTRRYCEARATSRWSQPRLGAGGATRSHARAEGHGRSSLLGDFVWWEHYCVAGSELVAEGYFEDASGERLNWDARIRPDSVPPPVPFATFSADFTFTGGTGRYAGLRGEAVVDAEQLGDAAPGRPAGSTAAALCGWVSE